MRLRHTFANNLLVCRSCAFNFDTPGVFSDVGEVAIACFLSFDGFFEEEASLREGPIRDRVERKRDRVKNFENPLSPSFLLLRLCVSRFYQSKMRNLGLRTVHNIALPNANVSAVAIDVEGDANYVTSERQNADADIEVEIYRLESQENVAVQVRLSGSVQTVTG